AIGRGPVPVGREVEQRTMREPDDGRVLVELLEAGAEPLKLLAPDTPLGIGHVVEHDEVHALVIERVMRLAEELLERLTLVERRVVFAGEIVVRLHLELRDRVAHVRQTLSTLLWIVGGVREIPREG